MILYKGAKATREQPGNTISGIAKTPADLRNYVISHAEALCSSTRLKKLWSRVPNASPDHPGLLETSQEASEKHLPQECISKDAAKMKRSKIGSDIATCLPKRSTVWPMHAFSATQTGAAATAAANSSTASCPGTYPSWSFFVKSQGWRRA